MGYLKSQRRVKGLFAPGPKSYEPLLRFECVRDWAENYPETTRGVYLRAFKVFVDYCGRDPDGLLTLKGEEAKRKLVKLAKGLGSQDKTGWASNIVKSVKSFYAYHDKELVFKRSERVRVRSKRIVYEKIPNRDEVYRMVDVAGNLRDKAVILCLWESGVRVSCLSRWRYGLVKGQIPLDKGELKIPIRLKITSGTDTKLLGYGLPYYVTFLGAEAAQALKDYLSWRASHGEELKDDSPIFVTDATTSRGASLNPNAIRQILKRCAKDAGMDPNSIWPHCLRKAFRKVLNAALDADRLDEDTKEALMGHRLPGSRGSYFDNHDIDEIARKYMKCDFSRVGTTVPDGVKKEMLLTLLRDQARMFGVNPMSIKIERDADGKIPIDAEIEALQLEVKKQIDALRLQREAKEGCNAESYLHVQNKIVGEGELQRLLDEGWQFVAPINNGRYVLRKPLNNT